MHVNVPAGILVSCIILNRRQYTRTVRTDIVCLRRANSRDNKDRDFFGFYGNSKKVY